MAEFYAPHVLIESEEGIEPPPVLITSMLIKINIFIFQWHNGLVGIGGVGGNRVIEEQPCTLPTISNNLNLRDPSHLPFPSLQTID